MAIFSHFLQNGQILIEMLSGQMRSLRIFYHNDKCTSGQLVIASRESQYKILHFHHGGLDRLSEILDEWKFLAQPRKKVLMISSLVNGYMCKRFQNPDLPLNNLIYKRMTDTCPLFSVM